MLDGSIAVDGGFTLADRLALENARHQFAQAGLWGQCTLLREEHGDFLVVWDPGVPDDAPPKLSLIRFKATGTYAAVTDAGFLATATTVEDLLRALPRDGTGH